MHIKSLREFENLSYCSSAGIDPLLCGVSIGKAEVFVERVSSNPSSYTVCWGCLEVLLGYRVVYLWEGICMQKKKLSIVLGETAV